MSDASIILWYAIVDKAHNIVARLVSIAVSEDLTIEDLTNNILNKRKYSDFNPADVNVYYSSWDLAVSKEAGFKEKVSAFLSNSQPLEMWETIKDCGIGRRRILFVMLPRIQVRYLLVDQNNCALGDVMTVSMVSVSDLRCRVKDERSNRLRHVDAADLVVWQYKSQLRTSTDNIDMNDAIRITGDPSLETLRLTDEDLLIVQFREQPLDRTPSAFTHTLGVALSTLRGEQLSARMVPSEMKGEKLAQLQQSNNILRVLCNRPAELAPTIPVALLHPILNEFHHDCENYTPEVQDYRFAEELSTLSGFYSNETQRQMAFLEACGNYGLKVNTDSALRTKYTTDGCIDMNRWPCLIVEFKNEIGSTGAEPVFQTAAYYRAYLNSRGANRLNFTCPCLGMYVVGPLIGFFGMAFTTHVNLQMLGLPMRLDFHEAVISQWTSLARHLGALRLAVDKLKTLYETDTRFMTMQVQESEKIFFPAYSHFDLIEEGRVGEVVYISQPFREKRLFHGKFDGERVVIKFVQRYSLEAHAFCAQNGWAPKLLGSRDLKGGWTIVVMEHLDQSWKMLSRCTKTTQLFDEVNNVLCALHQHGYAHGDVRDLNIMVKEEGGRCFIKFVDFDWAGKIEETQYPRNVGDSKRLRRPAGVYDGKPIRSEHDIGMLGYMFRDVVPCNSPWWTQPVHDALFPSSIAAGSTVEVTPRIV